MIIAVTAIVHGYELLPYYFDYYRDLGVEKFVLACEPATVDGTGELQRFLAAQSDLQLLDVPRTYKRSNLVGMIEEEVRLRIGRSDDWLIPADIDELNQYPCELPELVRRLERNGYTHVEGVLSDRLAPRGELVGLKPKSAGVSLWEQYPMEAPVTQRIARGHIEKVLISRGDLGWTMGHHHMRASPALAAYPENGVAHHFKWRDGVMRTLSWRVKNERRVGAGLPWAEESVRLHEYLEAHGRVRYEDVGATPGWRPGLSLGS